MLLLTRGNSWKLIASLSNDDSGADDDAWSKMNLYFTSEISNCLDLFNTPMALKTWSG